VNSNSPYRSVKDFIAAAKASPGKLNVGTTSIGATQFIAAGAVQVDGRPGFPDGAVQGDTHDHHRTEGQRPAGHGRDLAPLIPHIKSGNLRALAVTFDHRFVGLPDIPTLAEAGVPGYEASAWNGVAAPARTPRAVIERLNREINAAVAVPELRQRLQDLGVDARASSPEALRELLVSETAKWKAVIERAKIEKQ